LKLIATRGQLHLNFTAVYPDPTLSVTDAMLSVIPYFDFYAIIKPDTSARRLAGIGFFQPVADASLVLITTESPLPPSSSAWYYHY
jgi:hypothetical protein